ncbi:U1 snRNP protein [Dimargaris xerosporica]|nr:U1 snRNP protein [Dimargaris xerosporica]
MAAIPPTPNGASVWQEARTPEGKVYFYNSLTKKTMWEKPDELKTPEEQRALSQTAWKEYVADGGRTYYYNTVTKVTTWEKPQELVKDLVAKSPSTGPDSTPTSKPTQTADQPTKAPELPRPPSTASQRSEAALPPPPTLVPSDREVAFQALLREAQVQSDWTWEQAMRAIISHPRYRILPTVTERKEAFRKFQLQRAQEEKAEKRSVAQEQEKQLLELLGQTFTIDTLLPYRDAMEQMADEPVVTNFKGVRRREAVYNEFVHKLRQQYKSRRKEQVGRLCRLFQTCPDIAVSTRWKDLPQVLERLPEWTTDTYWRTIDQGALLDAFEQHMEKLKAEFLDWKHKQVQADQRAARKARDEFRQLLHEQRQIYAITLESTWTSFYPSVANDPRYDRLLGHPGSTPLELFWDEVEEHHDQISRYRRRIEGSFEKHRVVFTEDTPYDEFVKHAQPVVSSYDIDSRDLAFIYKRLLHRAKRERTGREQRELKRRRHRATTSVSPDQRAHHSVERQHTPTQTDLSEPQEPDQLADTHARKRPRSDANEGDSDLEEGETRE